MIARLPAYFHSHERNYEKNLYVYPVISRRSEGLSIGINLSQIKECNFSCEYCQVDRTNFISKKRKIDLDLLMHELKEIVDLAVSKEFFLIDQFKEIPTQYKVIKDISFSGDGEATASPFFVESANKVIEFIEAKKKEGVEIKPIVITNATMLHKPTVSEILQKMDEMGGGPWVKLDSGNEKEFQKISETNFSLKKILENIIGFSKNTPVVLQTILYKYSNGNFSFTLSDYIDCINQMKNQSAQFKHIQLYTLARSTKIKELERVPEETLKDIASSIVKKTKVDVKIYP